MTKNVNYVAPEMEVVATVVEAGFGLSNGDALQLQKYEVEETADW